MQQTILVTGGAGFIGSNLIDALLLLGYTVVSLDNLDSFYPEVIKKQNLQTASQHPAFFSYHADIRDAQALHLIFEKHAVDVVIHLAGKVGVRPSIYFPSEYVDVNVNGTIQLVECMRKWNIHKLIFASSSSIYGNNSKVPFAESDPVDFPISPYAATKKSAELLLHTYHELFAMDILCLRFFTVYGPRQRPDLAIHRFFTQLHAGKPIDVFGDGTTSRDYTFVADIINGISAGINYLLSHHKCFEIINLGNNTPLSLSSLLNHIEQVTEKTFSIHYSPVQPGDVERTYADISKAKQLLNYYPKTTLTDGLAVFKTWFEQSGTKPH